jgi:hypothetical protein
MHMAGLVLLASLAAGAPRFWTLIPFASGGIYSESDFTDRARLGWAVRDGPSIKHLFIESFQANPDSSNTLLASFSSCTTTFDRLVTGQQYRALECETLLLDFRGQPSPMTFRFKSTIDQQYKLVRSEGRPVDTFQMDLPPFAKKQLDQVIDFMKGNHGRSPVPLLPARQEIAAGFAPLVVALALVPVEIPVALGGVATAPLLWEIGKVVAADTIGKRLEGIVRGHAKYPYGYAWGFDPKAVK